MDKKIFSLGIVSLVLIGAAFYGGTVYGKKQTTASSVNRRGDFQTGNFSGRMNGAGGAFAGRGGNGNVNGEVISLSDKIITIKLRDGGSKNVIYSASTTVRMFTEAKVSELKTGKTVTVSGIANSDGSVTAQVIQIRDASSTFFGGPDRPLQR